MASPPVVSDAYPAIVPGGYLCIAWVLKGKRVLIVGGGPVAAGRLVNVKDADAHVTVICPSSGLNGEMKYRLARGEIDEYHDRLFEGEQDLDLQDGNDAENANSGSGDGSNFGRSRYDLVLTATDDIELSRRICGWCRTRRIPVNVADVPPECDFYFGSLIRRGPLQVMVSTGGKGPKIANQVRTRLERALPAELAEAISNVGTLRARLRKVAPESKQGPKRMRWMIDVCERWSWTELAQMDEDDMALVLSGWEAGKAISFAESRRRRRGTAGMGVSAVRAGVRKLGGRCPITGDRSPWLAGLVGFGAGVGVAVGMIALRGTGPWGGR
ncbi:unnamed protein product [Tilletia laevis]|uniref:precorrin-2 dehydrogenase n=2 Tax=Tilletia TaxID=13289 RepID=A0A177VGZ5_9BASI|nr:hypothetical protein CF336_g1026 [Tilletia laevis]KAE8247611.1 hypothetical protein A4X03_0g7002 [Tilletia caries]KAE8208067.1 hypothetical protein CF335_g686 [Tilletia laevis]CAD6887143.1 unnamed protein product [Tilletia caries]CAD6902931.1 unnamed protein product [Tilletia caries]